MKPRWTRRPARKAGAKADTAPAAVDTADNKQARNTVTGTVVSVNSYPGAAPETQSQRDVCVRVRTESGPVRARCAWPRRVGM